MLLTMADSAACVVDLPLGFCPRFERGHMPRQRLPEMLRGFSRREAHVVGTA